VLGHAANFLYMLTGERPSGLATRAFDVALTLHADHELNASTFAARVAAATLTDIHSAIVGAIGALKGPLHGGANADVMRCCSRSARTRAGEGGRVHPRQAGEEGQDSRIRSPRLPPPRIRAPRICGRCRATSASAPGSRCGSTCRSGSRPSSRPRRTSMRTSTSTPPLPTTRLGIAIDLFTPIFAVSRISGWTAHVLEQYSNNRLIRPRAEYIGPDYPQRYSPLEER
jgi:citrate synthase